MSYVFLFILFLPIKLLGKLFRKDTGKNLVIQTAKIGDFVNATPLLHYLQKSDVLISVPSSRWPVATILLKPAGSLADINAIFLPSCILPGAL